MNRAFSARMFFCAHKPRALPWAGMRDAVSVSLGCLALCTPWSQVQQGDLFDLRKDVGNDKGSNSRSLNLNAHGTMVGAVHVVSDESAFESRTQGGGDKEVINAPTDVPIAHSWHWTPPGVMSVAFLEFPEGINEAALDEGAKTSAFLRSKP